MANGVRPMGSAGVRRPSRAVSLDDARNPEVGGSNADRELIEGLQSGDLVATSSVHPGTGVMPKEQAESNRARADMIRNIAITALSIGIPAAKVIQLNKALLTAYTRAAATGQGGGTAALSNAFKRMQPIGDDTLTAMGKMDSPWKVGAIGGSYGSGMMTTGFQDMLGIGDMDIPEEMILAGLFGDMTRGFGSDPLSQRRLSPQFNRPMPAHRRQGPHWQQRAR